MVRDIRRVGIGEGVKIASGVRNSIRSGSVTILIVDSDSSGGRESRILSIVHKINGDSKNINLRNSSIDTSVVVYDFIIIFITILFFLLLLLLLLLLLFFLP